MRGEYPSGRGLSTIESLVDSQPLSREPEAGQRGDKMKTEAVAGNGMRTFVLSLLSCLVCVAVTGANYLASRTGGLWLVLSMFLLLYSVAAFLAASWSRPQAPHARRES